MNHYEMLVAEGCASSKIELARLFRDIGQMEAAVSLLREMSRYSALALYLLARYSLEWHGRVDDAIAVWRDAISQGYTWAHRPLAGLLRDWNRPKEAIVEYQTVLALGDKRAVGPLALLLESEGRMDEAAETWLQGIDCGNRVAHTGYAEFLARRGRLKEAIEEYEKGLLSCDVSARRGLLNLLERTGRTHRARDLVVHGFVPNGSESRGHT
jgi:tetratricopeptide (TPR) repeat protein